MIVQEQQSRQKYYCCRVKAFQGMFNWFRLLWSLNDEKLIEINGFEYTLYLVWLRNLSVFFALITFFNASFMLPTYLTGNPEIDPITHEPKALNSTMD